MEPSVLNDPATYPTEEVLASFLGEANAAFQALFERNHFRHPDFVETWKYYNDTKCWLLNVSRKKKTLFWLSIGNGWFRTTFYFPAKAEEVILGSALPEDLKAPYRESSGRKFRGITLIIRETLDSEPYEQLLGLKLGIR
jgi:hypothetical protein